MKQPPHDSLGVVPHDHDEILSDDRLIRYLVPGANVHLRDDGSWRVSSGAFSRSSPTNDPRNYASVDLERLLTKEGTNPIYRLPSPNQGVAGILVEHVRELKLFVGWVPLKDNNAHCGVWGELNKQSIRNKLAKVAILIVEPQS
jgi:hypothetical protein